MGGAEGPDWLLPEPISASICRAAAGAGWGLEPEVGWGVGAGTWVQRWPPGLGVGGTSPPNSPSTSSFWCLRN